MNKPKDHLERIERAKAGFIGLSTGDALGEQFFGKWQNVSAGFERCLVTPPWKITDDSVMALSILDVLFEHGEIREQQLALTFAQKYADDPRRGYGGGAHDILSAIGEGCSWQSVSEEAFDGGGSMGNGGAMRVAPLGAYLAFDDEEVIVEQATKSAVVTHAHAEGQAGAVAIALATAWATRQSARISDETSAELGDSLLRFVLNNIPSGETRDGIRRARRIQEGSPAFAAAELGCGRKVTAPDTVPFCLWCAAKNLDNYGLALRSAISVGGDIDTNCAIIGGIVVMSAGTASIPDRWRKSREITGWEEAAAWNHVKPQSPK